MSSWQRFHLKAHADCLPPMPLRVDAACRLAACGSLHLLYRVEGVIDALRIPRPRPGISGPADKLWQHTCCEAFIAREGEAGYREFNFSPSGHWATYRFVAYRERAPDGDNWPAPVIEVRRAGNRLRLGVRLDARALPPGEHLQLGLTVVLEAEDGHLSYWALAHPGERPDFHLRTGFTARLARKMIAEHE